MNLTTLGQESIAERSFYVPQFEIRIEGAGLPRDVLRDVTEVTYRDSLTEIDGFEITVNNWDADTRQFKYVGSETEDDLAGNTEASEHVRLFDPCNKQVEVKFGYLDTLRRMVLGTFTTLEPAFPASGGPTLTVRGLNALHQLRRKQYSTEWTRDGGWRDSEIARDIATRVDKDLGARQKRFPFPIVINPNAQAAEEPLPYVAQQNQYDIDFLLTRARRRGYVVYLREGDPSAATADEQHTHLYFGPSDGRVPGFRDVTFQLNRGATLIDFRPTLTTANQVKAVTVKAWDRVRKQPIAVRVSLDDKELAINKDLHQLLNVCDPREEIVVDKPVRSEKEAHSVAIAILKDRHKEMVKASVTTVGLPDLRAGMKVMIGGVGARFSGTYFITDTTHTINDGGYLTRFNARREVTGSLQGLE
jgi:Bacteriophage probable baseplate hub protein